MTAFFTSAKPVLFLLAVSMVWAQSPNPAQPYVQSIAYSGVGCPQGTVGSSLSNDRTSFTLIFDSFVAASGPAVLTGENSKSCAVSLILHLPAGQSVWAQTSTARGYTQLPAAQNTTIVSRAALSKPGGKDQDNEQEADDNGVSERTNITKITGPVSKDYLVVDGHQYSVQTGCAAAGSTRTITLQYTVAVSGPAASQATLDSIDGKIVVVKTKACKND